MKRIRTLTMLLVSLIVALGASAVTPKPSPSRTSNANPNPQNVPASTSPTPKPIPENLPSPSDQPTPVIVSTLANQPPPKPVLYLMSTEAFSTGGKNWIRYRYDVANKAEYPAEMFAAAPTLPPCGSNTNASRTWVDFFDPTGKRLYGFCALGSPQDLGKLWFALEEGVIPPSYVYIELNDRQTNTKYKSNLADTTL
jgi:hypothetical protein